MASSLFRFLPTLLTALGLLWGVTGAKADQAPGEKEADVEGFLIYAVASKGDQKNGFPLVQSELASRLGKVFDDYSHFQVLRTQKVPVYKDWENWFAPARDKSNPDDRKNKLALRMDSLGKDKHGGIRLHCQLWQSQKVLVKSDALLQKESPLLITGPSHEKGRLIFVIRLAEKSSTAPRAKELPTPID
ncbi:MAG: hypothetical protein AAF514_09645 [Verrucomicrobiota bacterium]